MDEGWHVLTEWWTGLSPLTLALAIALPAIVFVLRGWLGGLCISGINSILGRFDLTVEKSMYQRLIPAAGNILVLLAVYLGFSGLGLPLDFSAPALRIVQSLLICGIFWMINAYVQVFLAQAGALRLESRHFHESWLSQVIRFVLIAIMLVVVLKVWGIDLGPALTGIGIAGAAAALAAQDLIRNLIAGFSLAGEGRFREGDWIRITAEHEGVVEKVSLRSTVIRRFDNGKVYIPNSELANTPLSNFTDRTIRRLRWIVPLKFGVAPETLNKICDDVAEYISSNSLFLSGADVNPSVKLYEFADSSIDMLIDCAIASNDYKNELAARHDLVLATKRIVEERGAEFALPARAIQIEHGAL